ncbi:hypothetical protein C7M84_017066 [Penaeus vannamei]|uniref:Uncharacterized protein n=1 Tax=Penaeus vannamei TaxID=6689 RepID=A0A3R7SKS4_PENVA|nr:hypothetical protein C7M84_017066 [Penaeus vannamei]
MPFPPTPPSPIPSTLHPPAFPRPPPNYSPSPYTSLPPSSFPQYPSLTPSSPPVPHPPPTPPTPPSIVLHDLPHPLTPRPPTLLQGVGVSGCSSGCSAVQYAGTRTRTHLRKQDEREAGSDQAKSLHGHLVVVRWAQAGRSLLPLHFIASAAAAGRRLAATACGRQLEIPLGCAGHLNPGRRVALESAAAAAVPPSADLSVFLFPCIPFAPSPPARLAPFPLYFPPLSLSLPLSLYLPPIPLPPSSLAFRLPLLNSLLSPNPFFYSLPLFLYPLLYAFPPVCPPLCMPSLLYALPLVCPLLYALLLYAFLYAPLLYAFFPLCRPPVCLPLCPPSCMPSFLYAVLLYAFLYAVPPLCGSCGRGSEFAMARCPR